MHKPIRTHPVVASLDQHQFPRIYFQGQTPLEFYPSDDEKRFRRGLKIQGPDWIYRNRQVRYHMNSLGYRTQEFDQVDWERSLVIFGCSNTFGVGLDEEDTLGNQLSRIVNVPVINMGVGASSVYMALLLQLTMLQSCPRPVGVINCWTEQGRLTNFAAHGGVDNLGSWSTHHGLFRAWHQSDWNSQVYSAMAQQTVQLLYQSMGIWHYECSYFQTTTERFKCRLLSFEDRARDGEHPGINSQKKAAEIIADAWFKRSRRSQ